MNHFILEDSALYVNIWQDRRVVFFPSIFANDSNKLWILYKNHKTKTLGKLFTDFET